MFYALCKIVSQGKERAKNRGGEAREVREGMRELK